VSYALNPDSGHNTAGLSNNSCQLFGGFKMPPGATGTLRNMRIRFGCGLTGGSTAFSLGVASGCTPPTGAALTCTVSSGGAECTDATNEVVVTENGIVSLAVVSSSMGWACNDGWMVTAELVHD
jgi:hypothetical protein